MKAIVTIKLEPNPNHNPHNKQSGNCPLSGRFCTDVTGEHHSVIIEGETLSRIQTKAKIGYKHITRIEVIE